MGLKKVTFIFAQGQKGWTESYYRDVASSNLQAVLDLAMPLATARASLLGAQGKLSAIRVSDEDQIGDAFLAYTELPGDSTLPSDQSDAAVLFRFAEFDNRRHKHLFMRGIYDALNVEGGQVNRAQQAFATRSQSYAQQVVAGSWGWIGVKQGPTRKKVDIANYESDDEGLINFTLAEPLFPITVVGKTVAVRVSGVNRGSVLNGTQLVRVQGQSTCRTVVPVAAFNYSFGGKMLFAEREFIIATVVQAQKIVTRKAGSPLLGSVGRRKAKPRG